MKMICTPNHGEFEIEQSGSRVSISQAGKTTLSGDIESNSVVLSRLQAPVNDTWAAACYALFCSDTEIRSIQLPCLDENHPVIESKHNQCYVQPSALAQYGPLWLSGSVVTWYPQVQILDEEGRYHPYRPPLPQGELYRRFDAGIGDRVSLWALDIERHAQLFSDWQNSARISHFWEQAGSLEEHTLYLQNLRQDRKTLPVIGMIGDDPFAYFEVYWAKEDRIAAYCNAQDFDRGIHMLVGAEQHRGPHKVKAWLTSLCHFIFLNDARTQHIVSEPRADNDKMIGYMQKHRFARLKEFDFPHKRAALMQLSRDAFFDDTELFN